MDSSPSQRKDAFDPMAAVRAVIERKRLAAAVFLTIAMVSLLATLRIKPKYESDASIIVRLGRESAGLDPTATTSEITPIYETREQELNSALEVMQSRKLLEAVIGVLGEDVVLDPTLFSLVKWQQALKNTTWPELDPEVMPRSNATHEMAIEKVYRAVSIDIGRSSSVIAVTSIAATPELAQAMTKTLLEAVRAEQVRLNETDGLSFFTEQVAMLQEKLDRSRRAMMLRRNELRVSSVDAERARLEGVLTALENELNSLIPNLDGARASAKVMAEEVSSIPDRTQPHDATDTLRKTLHEKELKRTALLARFTPSHMHVRDMDAEIAMVREQLADPANRNAANPTLRELEVALANDHALIARTEAQIESFEQERTRLLTRLTELNSAEAEMMAMKDREGELVAALAKTSVKLEQARVLDELSRERISNMRVVQPPTFNPVSTSPPRSLVLFAGLVVAVVAACVIPAVMEFGTWYLRSVSPDETADTQPEVTEEVIICGG